MHPLDLLGDFLEDPRKAADAVSGRPPVVLGASAYLIAGLSLFLAQALLGRSFLLGISSFSLTMACLSRLVVGLGMSALLHILIEGLGGRGRAVPFFVLMGLSDLGWALALPGALFLRAVLPDAHWASTGLFFLVGLATLNLRARSIQHNYGLASSRAWLALSLPYLGSFLLLLVALSVALAGTLSQIIKLFS